MRQAEVDVLAKALYAWGGGIFWGGETTWQDRCRDEARQWFAYAALLGTLAAQRPEGVTVTEWGVRYDATGHTERAFSRRFADERLAELGAPSTLMQRQRTFFSDEVTEWVEVSNG